MIIDVDRGFLFYVVVGEERCVLGFRGQTLKIINLFPGERTWVWRLSSVRAGSSSILFTDSAVFCFVAWFCVSHRWRPWLSLRLILIESGIDNN